MKQYLYILVGVLLVFASCKKEEIPDFNSSQNSDGIYINGMLGTEPINLSSEGNYYMYSNFSYDTTNEVFVFEGELKERNCTECGRGIKLKVSNTIKSPGGIPNINLDSLSAVKSLAWKSLVSENEGQAEIIISDEDVNLSSYNSYQPVDNKLNIKDVQVYHNNEQGQKTIKVSFEGKANFTTLEGNKLFVFEGSFAFAYP